MQHYLYHETPSPQSHLTRAAIEKAAGDGPFYKLFEGDAVRLAKTQGLRAGASFLGLAVHSGRTSLNGRTCFPKVPTAARLTGQSTRATSGHFRGLDDDGFIKTRRRRRTSSMYTFAHSDSSKQRWAQISKPWLEAHRDVGASALFLLAAMLAMAGPRRTFSRRLDDLLRALGLPRSTFYRLVAELKQRGWMDWRCTDGLIELTMLENPVSKTTVLAVSKTAHEVDKNLEVARSSEEARSKPKSRSTPEARRAQTSACEPPLRRPYSTEEPDLQEETLPATNQEPELEVAIDQMLAKLGIKLTPPKSEPKPKVRSATQLLRDQGWIVTTDEGWPCAEKLGEHNCDAGMIFAPDERGHEFTLRCKVCLDAARRAQPEQQAEPATTHRRSGGFNVMEIAARNFFGADSLAGTPTLEEIFGADALPQLPAPRTIEEAQCTPQRPSTRALPASTIDDSFGSYEPPGWSKATSGPRRVIVNGALDQLHEVIRDSLGFGDLDPPIWRRINGMLCRMPHGTADEFSDAMAEAVEQLNEKREMHPGGRFYFDFEKSALWAVGRATGCSQWID